MRLPSDSTSLRTERARASSALCFSSLSPDGGGSTIASSGILLSNRSAKIGDQLISGNRRRRISKRVQKKSEALPSLHFVQSQKHEHARLQFLAVNADAPRSKLRSIQHQIVALRAHFLRCGFELMNVFFSDSRE